MKAKRFDSWQKAKRFDSWQEAYDTCREGNCPMIAEVNGERLKIFPSGTYQCVLSPCGCAAALREMQEAKR